MTKKFHITAEFIATIQSNDVTENEMKAAVYKTIKHFTYDEDNEIINVSVIEKT